MTLIGCMSEEAIQGGYATGLVVSNSAGSASGVGVRGNRATAGFVTLMPVPNAALWTAPGGSIIVGGAINMSLSTGQFAVARDSFSSAICFFLSKTSTGEVTLQNASSFVLATSTTAPLGTTAGWHYVEIKFSYVASTTATITVRVDGVTVITGTFTVSFNTSLVRTFLWEALANMDWYVLDSTGSTNNDFLGDVRVEHLVAQSEGANTGWSLGAGASKTAAVTSSDGDTSYVRTTTSNNRQTFVMSDLASTGGVPEGVTVLAQARAETNAVQKLAATVRSGGTSVDATNYGAPPNSTSYSGIASSFDINPVTGVAWTISDINALEAGVVVLP